MKQLILILLCSLSLSAWALPKEQRMDEALATIGAFVVEKQQEGTLGGYYGENNDVYFANKSENKNVNSLQKIGREYIEKILQVVAKPVCSKLKICNLTCYSMVAGDVIDMILLIQPELLPVKAAFQTYIIDGGMYYFGKLCKC